MMRRSLAERSAPSRYFCSAALMRACIASGSGGWLRMSEFLFSCSSVVVLLACGAGTARGHGHTAAQQPACMTNGVNRGRGLLRSVGRCGRACPPWKKS
jgi:hypothetical protein